MTLGQRIRQLRREGFSPRAISGIVGVDPAQVVAALADSTYEPPPSGGSGSLPDPPTGSTFGLQSIPAGFSTEVFMQSSGAHVEGIAIDDDYIYVVDNSADGLIKRAPIGLPALAIASLPLSDPPTPLVNPYDIFVDDDNIYFTLLDSGELWRVPKGQSTPTWTHDVLTTGLSTPYSIWADGTHIFITNNGTGDVLRADQATGTLDESPFLTGFTDCDGVWGDDTYLYVADYTDSIVKRCLKADGSGLETIIDDPTLKPYRLTADDNYLYIAKYDKGGIARSKKDGTDLTTIFDAGASGPLNSDLSQNIFAVRTDDDYLYLSGSLAVGEIGDDAVGHVLRINRPQTVIAAQPAP